MHDRSRLKRARPRPWTGALVVAALVATLLTLLAAPASAAPTTYSQTQTLPVPPASSFVAAGGGDGWDISLSNDRVFNVFHHNQASVACHLQSNAQPCWPGVSKLVRDGQNRTFYAGNHSGTHLEQSTGKLYLYAYRQQDQTGGVVCIDTTAPDSQPNLFCGFTALTAAGGSTIVGQPMLVGTRWYATTRAGSGSGGLLCFDIPTASACPGQPYAPDFTGFGNQPSETAGAVGTRLFIHNTSRNALACFDTTTSAECTGTWPGGIGGGSNGAPLPLLDAAGAPIGVCARGGNACLANDGTPAPLPANFGSVIPPGTYYNGPAVVIGPRIYAPNGNGDRVQCYDFSTSTGCPNFPKLLPPSFMYTVNADPQRPSCLWTNADYNQRIQSFDAYTGGACGQGAIRVLASQFVVPLAECEPTEYQRLEITSPARSTYTSGSVQFANGAGNPSGIPDQAIDAQGGIDLTGLDLDSPTGLPQFLINLVGSTGPVGQVVVVLTWTADYTAACVAPGTTVPKEATAIETVLVGGGESGPSIKVIPGVPVLDTATLTGANAAAATGTVTYTWFADSSCATVASAGAPLPITTPGSLPSSAPVTLDLGTYYVVASYSGDAGNLPSSGGCGDEVLKVAPADDSPPTITAAATTPANDAGWYAGDVTVAYTCVDEAGGSGIPEGACPDPVTLTGEGAAVSAPTPTVTDAAGNISAPSNEVTVGIDRTDPVVTFAGDSTYDLLETVAITCLATDALSGIANDTCATTTGPAWSFGPGTHTRTATATDKAGNSSSATTSFQVTATSRSLCGLVSQFTDHRGTQTSLCAHLTNFERSRSRGQAGPAAAQLEAFRKEATSRSGKQLSATEVTVLIGWANTL